METTAANDATVTALNDVPVAPTYLLVTEASCFSTLEERSTFLGSKGTRQRGQRGEVTWRHGCKHSAQNLLPPGEKVNATVTVEWRSQGCPAGPGFSPQVSPCEEPLACVPGFYSGDTRVKCLSVPCSVLLWAGDMQLSSMNISSR